MGHYLLYQQKHKGVPEREDRERSEELFEEIMAEYLPNLIDTSEKFNEPQVV